MLQKVISGSETGVSEAALRAALACKLEVGGRPPRQSKSGERTSESHFSGTPSDQQGIHPWDLQTERNVRDADVTLALQPATQGIADVGTGWACKYAQQYGKALLACDPFNPESAERIVSWLRISRAVTVNVTGPREDAVSGIGQASYDLLMECFAVVLALDPTRRRRIRSTTKASTDTHGVASKIYRLRTEAGLVQDELAELVGTTRSAICRMEDPRYHGHSLKLLRRVAAAVGKAVEVHFVPQSQAPAADLFR